MVQLSDEDLQVQTEYDDMYYSLDSDSEDFCNPLQTTEPPAQLANSSKTPLTENSTLNGDNNSAESSSNMVFTTLALAMDSQTTDIDLNSIHIKPVPTGTPFNTAEEEEEFGESSGEARHESP
jgi:hypothetical protein